MKLIILLTLALSSLNIFSAELGENQKSECPHANQSAKREAKIVVDDSTKEVKQESTKGISK